MFKSIVAILLSSLSLVVYASDPEQLAKETQNPVADLISVPFQNNTNFTQGYYNRIQNILNIQPVIPIHLTESWNLVTRWIMPVVHQPKIFQHNGSYNGLGDFNPSLFISPAHPGKLIWGLGPTFLLPTATNRYLGQGKWGAGPSVVLLTMPGNWVVGILINNIWSVAGNEARPPVNQFLTQYFINYNFKEGWYLSSAPIITANWYADSQDRWVVPFGGGFGRVFKLGSQSFNASIAAYYNLFRPRDGSDWQVRTQIQLLFPE